MKKIGLLMIMVATFAFTSCGMLGGSSPTSSAAVAGNNASKALIALYNSNKANGTISITNPMDLANIATLISSYSELKSHKDDAEYKTQFTTGMISAGGSLINANNATGIMNAMLNTTGINSDFNKVNLSEKMQTVTAIITLLNMLK